MPLQLYLCEALERNSSYHAKRIDAINTLPHYSKVAVYAIWLQREVSYMPTCLHLSHTPGRHEERMAGRVTESKRDNWQIKLRTFPPVNTIEELFAGNSYQVKLVFPTGSSTFQQSSISLLIVTLYCLTSLPSVSYGREWKQWQRTCFF